MEGQDLWGGGNELLMSLTEPVLVIYYYSLLTGLDMGARSLSGMVYAGRGWLGAFANDDKTMGDDNNRETLSGRPQRFLSTFLLLL